MNRNLAEDYRKRCIKLEEKLSKDEMTGLYNKKAAFDLIGRIMENETELRHGMIVFDIDNFKEVNDNYGHSIGDEILIHFAGILKKTFRKNDIIARFGGDEYIVFMPDAKSRSNVRRKANQVMNLLYSEVECKFNQMRVSVSAGIAMSEKNMDPQELFDNADEALYDAKKKGKNRLSIYDDEKLVSPEYKEVELLERSASGGVAIYKIHEKRLEVVYFSESLPNLTGRSKMDYDQYRYKDAWELVYPNDLPIVKETIKKSISTGTSVDTMFRIIHKDGQPIWVQAVGQWMQEEDECPIMHVVFNNVSSYVSIYMEILDLSDNIVFLSDRRSYEILYMNRAGMELHNYNRNNFLGQTCFSWFKEISEPCDDCPITEVNDLFENVIIKEIAGKRYSIKYKPTRLHSRDVFAVFLTDLSVS